MPAAKQKVYLFNWPCPVGGAGTKVTHLLRLLANDYDWTCVPNTAEQYADVKVRRWLARRGIKAARWEELPQRLDGWGLCICNTWWLLEGRASCMSFPFIPVGRWDPTRRCSKRVFRRQT